MDKLQKKITIQIAKEALFFGIAAMFGAMCLFEGINEGGRWDFAIGILASITAVILLLNLAFLIQASIKLQIQEWASEEKVESEAFSMKGSINNDL